jgi:predicted peptidase
MNLRFLVLIFAVFAPHSIAQAANVEDFIDFSLRRFDGVVLRPGRLYVPPEAASAPRPLILFLHGAGEQGLNNLNQINQNVDNLLAEAKERGAYLFAPQTNIGWSNTAILNQMALMLDLAIEQHNVDANRLYVTGISLGGGGVWTMIDRYPDRFAAAVPIVGASGVDPANVLDQAIWAFHPRDDFPDGTRNVIRSILTAANEPLPSFPPLTDATADYHFDSQLLDLHYTEPAAGGHGYFVTAYALEPMYDWMFAHGVVPEPSSLLLLFMAAWFLCGRYRYVRQNA